MKWPGFSSAFPLAATLVIVAAIAVFGVTGCGETTVEVIDPDVDVGGNTELPDARVLENRPANQPTSYIVSCPWGEVDNPIDNPYLIGNLGPDAIPSIDNPKFIPISQVGEVFNFEQIIAVEFAGQVRGFPVRILLHHEIVNMCWDLPGGGQQFSYLTYCPLVDAAIHFVHDFPCGRTKGSSFGVSGGIFNGNLTMFQRGSGSNPKLFVQLYAGGIDGSCTTVEPTHTSMSWSMFSRLYPNAKVLSTDTGSVPQGGYDFFDHPYFDYWRTGDIWFPLDLDDDRIANRMTPVYGVLTDGGRKAYRVNGKTYVQNDTIGGHAIVVFNDAQLAATTAFEPIVDGQTLTFAFLGREGHGLPLFRDAETASSWNIDGIAVDGPLAGIRLPRATGIRVFWFAWASLYPTTELFVPE